VAERIDVAPHALLRFRDRVDASASLADAEVALRVAFRGARRLHAQGSNRALYEVELAGASFRLAVRELPGQPRAIISVLPPHEGDGPETEEADCDVPIGQGAVVEPAAPAWDPPADREACERRRLEAVSRQRDVHARLGMTRDVPGARELRRALNAEARDLADELGRLKRWRKQHVAATEAARVAAQPTNVAIALLARCRAHVPGELAAEIDALEREHGGGRG
jgi:hypothetical protein